MKLKIGSAAILCVLCVNYLQNLELNSIGYVSLKIWPKLTNAQIKNVLNVGLC